MKINFKKFIPIILVHLAEIIVLCLVVAWILNNGPANYSMPAAIIMFVFYIVYFVLSLSDDYKEYNKGDFDY